ncbi:MAG: ribonuclease P protein component [Candidatus Ratteibacteria bacterium]|nr:ribonuclease P protein component [Candidatus Ratteibacteria bacterium]
MRIRKRILLLKKTGRQYKSSFFRLYILPLEDYRIGFITGSKIGNASHRNYTKRVIRNLWQKELKKSDFLFVLYKTITRSERNCLIEKLNYTVEKIRCEKF